MATLAKLAAAATIQSTLSAFGLSNPGYHLLAKSIFLQCTLTSSPFQRSATLHSTEGYSDEDLPTS